MAQDFSDIENLPAVMISYDHQISDGRIIRFSTGLAQQADPKEYNALLDKLVTAADRQEARCQLERLQNDLKREEKLYVQQQEDLARLDGEHEAQYQRTGRKAPWSAEKLSPAQLTDRKNADISIARRRDMILALRDQVAKVQARAAAHADGATNSH